MRSAVVLDGSLDELPAMLTVEEAARVLRIGRSLGYQLANRYLDSGGVDGLPVLRLGGVLRVPSFALRELIASGTITQLFGTPPSSQPSHSSPPRHLRRVSSPDPSQLSLAIES